MHQGDRDAGPRGACREDSSRDGGGLCNVAHTSSFRDPFLLVVASCENLCYTAIVTTRTSNVPNRMMVNHSRAPTRTSWIGTGRARLPAAALRLASLSRQQQQLTLLAGMLRVLSSRWDGVSMGQANGSKENLRKFMDSVLQKQAKLRSLALDLEKNFADELATRPMDCHAPYM